MQTINTKFGPLYVENFLDRSEPDRVKIYDSNKRYLEYVFSENFDHEQFAEKLKTFTDIREMLYYIGVSFVFVTIDWKDVWWYLRKPCQLEDETRESIEENEFVNKIGNTYIVISEC